MESICLAVFSDLAVALEIDLWHDNNPPAELRKFVILILIKDQEHNAAITLP